MTITEKVKELSRELKIGLTGINKCRIDLITLAVISMCSVGSINLVKVAHGMLREVKVGSNYRRLQRFIAEVDWTWVNLPMFLINLIGIKGPYTLLIDRTNWKFGSVDINILVVAVLGEGFAIPVIWALLPKRGNSVQYERRDIVELLIKSIGKDRIKHIVADREFIGQHWFNWLITNQISFVIRIRDGMKVSKNGKSVKAKSLFNKNRKSIHTLRGKYKIAGNEVYLSGFRFRNDKNKLEYLILVSPDKIDDVCEVYSNRWYIENMFKDLKSNGFQLEQTHVTRTERLETLFGLLAIAYAWMIKIGTWIRSKKPELFKKTKLKRPRISVFRAGLNEFSRTIITNQRRKIWIYFRFLSCT